LPQENNGSVPEQVISEEIEQPSAEEPLQLQPTSEHIQPQFTLKSIQSQQEHLPLSTLGEYMHTPQFATFELPETPAPLPLVYQDIAASMLTNPADETPDDPPARLQFAPLLRLNGARKGD